MKDTVAVVPTIHPELLEGPVKESILWHFTWLLQPNIPELLMYSRYAALLHVQEDWVYTQDDDCIVDIPALLECYEPGTIVCNIRHTHLDLYTPERMGNICPVGWGAVFDSSLIEPSFRLYEKYYGKDDLYFRRADRIFTGLAARVKRVRVDCVNAPWAYAENRVSRQEGHYKGLEEIRGRVKRILGEEERAGHAGIV